MTTDALRQCWETLGISDDMRRACHLPLVAEATELIDAGMDVFDRRASMTPATLAAWRAMREHADLDGVVLQLVSAYRSIVYQSDLIQRKLDAGQVIRDILQVNAPPGYSEHHTGRALDLTTPGCEVLTEAFESTTAFEWLCSNAGQHGFTLSYPRDNPSGIDYEPWHWAYGNQ